MKLEEIRELPGVEHRVETGPIRFGEDWPGTFIRGDNAFAYLMYLEKALDVFYRLGEMDKSLDLYLAFSNLNELAKLLHESNINPKFQRKKREWWNISQPMDSGETKT